MDRPELREKIADIFDDTVSLIRANPDLIINLYEPTDKVLALIPDIEADKNIIVELADKQVKGWIEEAKKQLIAHIEKNCKGYEDRTVGTLMDSAFWRSLKGEK